MALASSRLRRALTEAISSSLLRRNRPVSAISCSSFSSLQSSSQMPSSISIPTIGRNFQVCGFRSSSLCASSRSSYNDDEKISPDTILFEGCDYNHWLITMDFPKDPKPTPEEMVETYVQTLAKVVGSVEEAKKRMYACSTTTYTGFQAVMTEEMSEKFRGLPGVVFILPDSYIDPVNKEYGGDKYINGTIIPRPPPVQYGRQGRYVDRNRNRQDGSNFEPRRNQGPPNNFGTNPNVPGDGRNYGPEQNYPRQGNFGPNPTPQGDGRSFEVRPKYAPQQNYEPNHAPQQNYGPSPSGQGERRDPLPMSNRDYVPAGGPNYHGERRDPMPSYQRDLPQVGRREYAPAENRDFRGDNRSFTPPSGGYGQGASSSYGQGASSSYGQSYPGHGDGAGSVNGSYPGRGEGQVYPQMDKRDGMQGQQQNFNPMGQMKNDQWGR